MTTALASSPLTYSTFIPREYVHRAAICEVFLTDFASQGPVDFRVGVQLPRGHSYYSDHDTTPTVYDPLLILECFRQASMALAHKYFEAPLDHKFVFNSGALLVASFEALRVGPTPANAAMDATVMGKKVRDGHITGLTASMTMILDGTPAAHMEMTIQWMPTAAWDRIRAKSRAESDVSECRAYSLTDRLAPAAVARRSADNVLVCGHETRGDRMVAQILVDQCHPGLFDHPLDHIPAALIFEAIRQTATVAAHELFGLSPRRLTLAACSVSFVRFGELELPTDCEVAFNGQSCMTSIDFIAEVRQERTVIAEGSVTLRRRALLETVPVQDLVR